MPLVGRRASATETLISACSTEHAGEAPGEITAEADRARAGRRAAPRQSTTHEERHQRQRADHAELLGDDGEDEVRVRIGQEIELLHALAGSEAEDAARADRDQRLQRLEAAAERVLLRLEEGEQPLAPVVGTERISQATTGSAAPRPITSEAPGEAGEEEQHARR